MNLEQVLNQRIADFGVLYVKLHRFHWYVKGKHFFALHSKFEEFYDEITEYLDEYAERLLSINGKPVATLKEFLEITCISEDGNEETAEDMVKTVIKDYSLVVTKLKEAFEVAEENNDTLTADLFMDTIGAFEKHLWMLNQYVA